MELFKLFGTIGINNANAISAINETTSTAETSSNKMITAFKRVGTVIATVFAVDKIKDFAVSMVQTAANVQAENAQFEASFKDLANEANLMFDRVSTATGVFATRLKTTGTKAFSQFKGAGIEANEALAKTETFLNLASDAAAYYDISLEDAEARIRSFLRGNVEAGDAIGLFTSESQRNSYAVEMYGKKWIGLTEAQKQNLMLKVAEDIYTQSGAIGQAQREADGLANVTGNLKEVWRQFLAVIGSPALKFVTPIIQKLTGKVTELKDKVGELEEWIANNQDTIQEWKNKILDVAKAVGVLVAAWAGFKVGSAIQNLIMGFQSARVQLALYTMQVGKANIMQGVMNGQLTLGQIAVGLWTGKISLTTLATNLWAKAQAKLNVVLTANPIGVIIMAIAALVAILAVAYNKSESFREVCNKLFGQLKEITAVIMEELEPVFEELTAVFDELWKMVEELIIPAFKEILDALKELWTAIKPILEAILPIIKKITSAVTKLVTNNLKNTIQGITVALNTIKNLITFFTALFKGDWEGAWNAIKNIFIGIWEGIKKSFSNTIETLKNIFGNAWEKIKSTAAQKWNEISEKITAPFKKARDKIKEFIDSIKGFFKNFTTKIKLPHFKIKNASLNPKDWIEKGIPKLSVEWYKDGGIMTQPTAFGINPATGNVMAGGEAGNEAIAPIDTLLDYVQTAVRAENSGLSYQVQRLYDIVANFLPIIAGNMGNNIVLDSGALVGQLAPAMDKKLGAIYSRKARY